RRGSCEARRGEPARRGGRRRPAMLERAGAQNGRVVSAFGPPRRGGESAASLGRGWASRIVERYALAEASGGPDRGRQGRPRRHCRDRSGPGGEGPTWLGRRIAVDQAGP